MQMELIASGGGKPIGKLAVVRNFRQVIETRDISLMNKELYQFLNLYCGFIAHYDINGFKATYSAPKDFAEVFIRHFDREHCYFDGIYPCHEEAYKDSGFTKAEIKREFNRIVEIHKAAIGRWAENKQRSEREQLYLMLKQEFEDEPKGQKISCDACGNAYEVKVIKKGEAFTDFDKICCLFCGHQTKLYEKRR